MQKTLKNSQMAVMRNQLRPLLVHRDKIGYIAARNFRILSESLIEYDAFRNGLIEKYGEKTTDERGASVIQIGLGSPNFQRFCDELAPFNEIEHTIELMTGKFDDAIGCLSGEEILAVDWMLED